MLANLSSLLEKYSPVPLEEIRDYLTRQYEENLLEIYEGMLMLVLNEDKEPEILSKEAEKIRKDFAFMFDDGTIEEYVNAMMKGLQKLIDELMKNEIEFYTEALNSDNPNFLITTYYSMYLRFVTKVYLKLNKIGIKTTKDSRIRDIFNVANFLVGFFGMPILLYIKKKEVFPHASELSGALLHALVADRTPVPSKDSLGYYLFFRIHAGVWAS